MPALALGVGVGAGAVGHVIATVFLLDVQERMVAAHAFVDDRDFDAVAPQLQVVRHLQVDGVEGFVLLGEERPAGGVTKSVRCGRRYVDSGARTRGRSAAGTSGS